MSEKYDRSRSLDLRSGSQPIAESRFASSSTSVIKKMMWNSKWLSVPVLLAFSAIFILLAVGTAGAYSFSVEHSGFHVPMNVLHYAWTLAPTFGKTFPFEKSIVNFRLIDNSVFMVFAVMWRQVDYYVKLLMPWENLRSGPRSANETVLLDYITPLLPVTILRAIKARHFPVVLSSLTQMLLLITVRIGC